MTILQPKKLSVLLAIKTGICEIVERVRRDADDVISDKRYALSRAIFRVLECAFPLENSPTGEIIPCHL